ncbi:class II glutamine amidotransferase [Streptomyces atriruber]|uniref:class II glutamine amidotransferase n=1 Tax=Streptomyces atriruber TaxID=545121 RepID=UPI000ADC1595|nr:class II glutamine amidotransferase [Streptomyces atriruber]
MCRMMVAYGDVSAKEVLGAAIAMSKGESADHDNPTLRHQHGWGAVWSDPQVPAGIAVHRDTRPIAESAHESGIEDIRTDFLAVHVRNATLEKDRGYRFTHPLQRSEDDWYFMHNGYMPTVHKMLGMEESVFDTAEYFEYIIPHGATFLDEKKTLTALRDIPAGQTTSGNAIAVRPGRAHVVHWSPPDTPTPLFFTLFKVTVGGCTIIASDRIPVLAPTEQWGLLPAETVLDIPINDSNGGEEL